MIKVGITGINGLIGWHLHAFLHGQPNIMVVQANRKTFASQKALSDFVASSDVVVHLAGMNRGDERTLAETNIALTKYLIGACEHTNRKPHIIFSSSTHIFRDTPYGNSKKECSRLFQKWSEKTGALFTNLILPNIFAEAGKPFYNSVVSTFCHQLANEQQCKIIDDITLEQLHAQSLAREIFEIIKSSSVGDVFLTGTPISVSELLIKLTEFSDKYQQHIIPNLNTDFDLQLFNTYRSYLYPKKYPVSPVLHKDERGTLFDAIKSLNSGQTFISTTYPGITRGNHYHTTKLERFLVVNGKAEIRIRKLFSNDVLTFRVSGDNPQYIDIPTLHTHNITNVGKNTLMTLFWSHELFDPIHPDTYTEPV